MTMKATAAERRRAHTKADLHEIALSLAEAHGVDWVTADKIASAARVSTRTFFNYFRNKEEAILGLPLQIPEDANELLATTEGELGPLIDRFLLSIFTRLQADRARLQRVMAVISTSPELTHIRARARFDNYQRILEALSIRYADEKNATCAHLAAIITEAVYAARDAWLAHDDVDLEEAVASVSQARQRATSILTV